MTAPPSPPPQPPPPPLAPPPPTFLTPHNNPQPAIPPPNIPSTGPPDTIPLSLLIYNGWPFANHWEYFFASPWDPDVGVVVGAAGNVREGFTLEVKRGWDVRGQMGQRPDERVALGWVGVGFVEPVEGVFGCNRGHGGGGSGGGYGYGEDMGFEREVVVEGKPRCELERILFKVPAPEKTLRDAQGDGIDRRAKITQRNCQTWVIESAEQLVTEGIVTQHVVDYLRARKQY